MRLTILGLPIGNIGDLSERAINRLSETEFIVCEDTRMFNNLWSKLRSSGKVDVLKAKLKFVNDFNEYRVLPGLVAEMGNLSEAVLVSDAGMPLISDPGYKLVRQGLELGWEVEVIPGPTAESSALAVSGLPTDKYMFLGFLPKKPGKRREMLDMVKKMWELMDFSVVIYESSARIKKTLVELEDVFGEKTLAALSIDLTKSSDKTIRGTLGEVIAKTENIPGKGEMALVIHTEI